MLIPVPLVSLDNNDTIILINTFNKIHSYDNLLDNSDAVTEKDFVKVFTNMSKVVGNKLMTDMQKNCSFDVIDYSDLKDFLDKNRYIKVCGEKPNGYYNKKTYDKYYEWFELNKIASTFIENVDRCIKEQNDIDIENGDLSVDNKYHIVYWYYGNKLQNI